MINKLLLKMLVRQVKNGRITVDEIVDELYRNEVKEELDKE